MQVMATVSTTSAHPYNWRCVLLSDIGSDTSSKWGPLSVYSMFISCLVSELHCHRPKLRFCISKSKGVLIHISQFLLYSNGMICTLRSSLDMSICPTSSALDQYQRCNVDLSASLEPYETLMNSGTLDQSTGHHSKVIRRSHQMVYHNLMVDPR